MNTHPKIALITGASSGIGAEYARQLASSYQKLLLVARREDKLQQVCQSIGGKAEYLALDLIQPEDREKLYQKVRSLGGLSLLVNNAGFGTVGSILEQESGREVDMIKLNCLALTELSLELIPELEKQASLSGEDSGIINLASIAAFLPMPRMTTYAASKAYVRSFSLALRQELRESKIKVLCHCPGPVPTEFRQVSGLNGSFDFPPGMSAEKAVSQALAAYKANRAQVINGWVCRALLFISNFIPDVIVAKLIESVLKRDKPVQQKKS